MNRLTISKKDNESRASLLKMGDNLWCCDICDDCEVSCDTCPIGEAFTRLSEYEDIGTVEEFLKLKQR